MWQFLKNLIPVEHPAARDEKALELAMAALLVRASVIDDTINDAESERIRILLTSRFGLSEQDVSSLIQEAREAEAEAIDLYRFTRVITDALDQDGRKQLIEMLWEVVLADGKVDPFEENLVWRVAELIGVSTRDRVTMRKAVETRL
ncbi:putative tellurite resistance protein B-like protein [Rhodoligotrophos appendicifer]|uniref:tellurite resistance TerB family protein n=1 Tax=Rhodoligotrophos appendicifer TaxID=987056 RepID=UPI00117FE6F4|nr:TerB family tellurite resistance protein [Rhodoligotrophos appendicifer]